MLKKNPLPGKLIVVEGIDGSGKSTQIDLIHKWLTEKGKSVFFSEWNSSPLVKKTTKRGKKRRVFTPTTFSLIQAADFADRWENLFLPMLKAGVIVLADRYAFTGLNQFAAIRGVVDLECSLYSFAYQPDLVLYFQVTLDEAVERITSARVKIKYYEAGMDLGLSNRTFNSGHLFMLGAMKEYEKMIEEFNFHVIDATRPIQKQQKDIRKLINRVLYRWKGLPNPVLAAREYSRRLQESTKIRSASENMKQEESSDD